MNLSFKGYVATRHLMSISVLIQEIYAIGSFKNSFDWLIRVKSTTRLQTLNIWSAENFNVEKSLLAVFSEK